MQGNLTGGNAAEPGFAPERAAVDALATGGLPHRPVYGPIRHDLSPQEPGQWHLTI